ncbi:MAG: ABC transporter ATP-binding protein [Clostridia bacterium]|nr:ABC transporter ATP-binding protein [Clostridia bacterium]
MPKNAAPVEALKGINVQFGENGMIFILGKSGCGKSTLLNLLGGLDYPTAGEIVIEGKSSAEFTKLDYDNYRNTYVGFVFQEYNLLNEFTVRENVGLALQLQGKKPNGEQIDEMLKKVGLELEEKRRPSELSGGQKQRVAIARALIKEPKIIFADEPTGALDSKTGNEILTLLKELSRDRLVIVVSHDEEFAYRFGDRVIEMADGQIIKDTEQAQAQA